MKVLISYIKYPNFVSIIGINSLKYQRIHENQNYLDI